MSSSNDHVSFSLGFVSGRFLGSKDRIIVGGNGVNNYTCGSTIQILYANQYGVEPIPNYGSSSSVLNEDNEETNADRFYVSSELALSNHCTGLEICGKSGAG